MSQDVTTCPECQRRTPSGRGKCIYCGADLIVTNIAVAPAQRAIESFELAYNTVIGPGRVADPASAETALATALGIEPEEARQFVAAQKYLPLSRSQTRHEAELVAALVRTCGFPALVVEDTELNVGTELIRAKRVEAVDDKLLVTHGAGTLELPASSICLILVGMVRSDRVEYTETGSGLRGNQEANVMDSYEFRSDLMLMDVYAPNLQDSFRIQSDGFNYSGLVQPLSYRAEANFQEAARALAGLAPQAIVDDDFSRVRRLLARAWPERTRNESLGIRRGGSTFSITARSSVVRDNRDQFERYSRLMFQLAKLKKPSPSANSDHDD